MGTDGFIVPLFFYVYFHNKMGVWGVSFFFFFNFPTRLARISLDHYSTAFLAMFLGFKWEF